MINLCCRVPQTSVSLLVPVPPGLTAFLGLHFSPSLSHPPPPDHSSRMVLDRLHSSAAGRLSGSVHSHFLSVVFSPNDSTFLLTAADDASSYTDRKHTPPPDRRPVDSAKFTSCGDCLCCLFYLAPDV